MKHTPGPWALNNSHSIVKQDGEGSYVIAKAQRPTKGGTLKTEESKANANLIAAAPDMLEALKGAVKECEDDVFAENQEINWFNDNMPGVGQTIAYKTKRALPAWVDQAKTAIEKAEGKQ